MLTLGIGIALAYKCSTPGCRPHHSPGRLSRLDEGVEIVVRGRSLTARVERPPFVDADPRG